MPKPDNSAPPLDRIDRRILQELQDDCRISFTTLAARVGLTTSPCIERVRSLRRDGYISSFSAILDPAKFDAALIVLVQISLEIKTRDTFNAFRGAVKRIPEVQECYLVTGQSDFIIKVRLSDIAAYKTFLEERLLTIPNVKDSESIVVMEVIKDSNFVPA